jgi:hypothetical protein
MRDDKKGCGKQVYGFVYTSVSGVAGNVCKKEKEEEGQKD